MESRNATRSNRRDQMTSLCQNSARVFVWLWMDVCGYGKGLPVFVCVLVVCARANLMPLNSSHIGQERLITSLVASASHSHKMKQHHKTVLARTHTDALHFVLRIEKCTFMHSFTAVCVCCRFFCVPGA